MTGRTQLKGAFPGCKWCHGSGCMCCDRERERAIQRAHEPILSFTHAELDDPTMGPLIKNAIGAEALQKAFGSGGGGMQEVEFNCAVASLVQLMRKCRSGATEDSEEEPQGQRELQGY